MNDLGQNKRSPYLVLGLILGAAACAPLITSSPYILNVLILTGLHIILAASNRLILRSGVWFLGTAAFYAVGVYTVLLARQFLGLNYWLALPLAGLAAGLVALGLGYAHLAPDADLGRIVTEHFDGRAVVVTRDVAPWCGWACLALIALAYGGRFVPTGRLARFPSPRPTANRNV